MLHLVICIYFNSSLIALLLLLHDHVSICDVVIAFLLVLYSRFAMFLFDLPVMFLSFAWYVVSNWFSIPLCIDHVIDLIKTHSSQYCAITYQTCIYIFFSFYGFTEAS